MRNPFGARIKFYGDEWITSAPRDERNMFPALFGNEKMINSMKMRRRTVERPRESTKRVEKRERTLFNI